jgi:hypothetical protein
MNSLVSSLEKIVVNNLKSIQSNENKIKENLLEINKNLDFNVKFFLF